jgi:hypothetical protein
MLRRVEARRRHLGADCHADRAGHALPKGAGGGLHAAWCASQFRVPGRLGMELAEALELRCSQA